MRPTISGRIVKVCLVGLVMLSLSGLSVSGRAGEDAPLPIATTTTMPLATTTDTASPTSGVTPMPTSTGTAANVAPPGRLTLSVAPDLMPLAAGLAADYHRFRPDTSITATSSGNRLAFDAACAPGQARGVIGVGILYAQDAQLAEPGCADMINVPLALGALPVVYALPGAYFARRAADGVTPLHPLRLTAQAMVSVYLGLIRRWDDPAIARLNPGAPLPHAPIRPFHAGQRGDPDADGVFGAWLAQADPRWRAADPTPWTTWPRLTSASGLPAGDPLGRPYSLGFATYAEALAARVQIAQLRNAAGTFVAPSRVRLASTAAALAAAMQTLPDGVVQSARLSLVALRAADAFAPSYLVFALVHHDLGIAEASDLGTARAIKDFLVWSVSYQGGQQDVANAPGYRELCADQEGSGHDIAAPCSLRPSAESLADSIIIAT